MLNDLSIIKKAFFRAFKRLYKVYPTELLKRVLWYHSQFKSFKSKGLNPLFKRVELVPYLFDNTSNTPIDYVYLYQDCWAAKHIFQSSVDIHVDIGSSVKSMALISQQIPVTMVDIRPPDIKLEGFTFKCGSILNLPFKNNSVKSLSSLCVIEHVGLGRYGDEIDPYGTEKAIDELVRVLEFGGILLVSVPIFSHNKISFNAHRAFTRETILSLFSALYLIEEKYQYGSRVFDLYDPEQGFGTGLFKFEKKHEN